MPTPATKISTVPSVSSQISGPVDDHGLQNSQVTNCPGRRPEFLLQAAPPFQSPFHAFAPSVRTISARMPRSSLLSTHGLRHGKNLDIP